MGNHTETNPNIVQVVANFCIEGGIKSIQPFGSGHINDTYRVTTDAGKNYLLQKINHFVFKDVPGLIDNIAHVTEHLKQKLSEIPGAKPEQEVITLVPAANGLFFTKDIAGNYWRV